MTSIVEAAIARVNQLATLPEVALEVMRLAEDPRSSGEDLDRVLSTDAALSVRVLRIVNSAFYGVRREVTSIGTAIVVLGFSAVKNIAVAASLARMFRVAASPAHFEPRDLWTHAIAVAAAARLLAVRVGGIEPSDAFLAGLIHDIGLIVELQACREPFLAVVAAAADDPARHFGDLEREIIGATHEEFGEGLCRAWRFPASLQRVASHHHRPMDLAVDERRLAAVIHVADHVAARCAIGYARTVDGGEVDAALLAWLGLTADDIGQACEALPAIVADVMPMLGGGT